MDQPYQLKLEQHYFLLFLMCLLLERLVVSNHMQQIWDVLNVINHSLEGLGRRRITLGLIGILGQVERRKNTIDMPD